MVAETDFDERIAELSPDMRDLLLERLSELQKGLGAGEARETAPIAPLVRSGDLPLSFAQQRLWFLDRLLPDKAAYNIPMAWRLRGPLDVPALERSLNALVARHETLRTRFAVREGTPLQIIDPPQSAALPLIDLSAMPQAEREARALQIANAHARKPFDLEAGPLLCAQLLRLAPEEHLLLCNVHHIAFDGWSMGVFARELCAAYGALAKGREPALPVLPIQYADYAVWQRQWLQGEVLDSQLGYWKDNLAGLAPLELPTDRPRPPLASHKGSDLAFDLPAPLTTALKALARREGATLFMTLVAAFQVLLYRYSGQEDIAVGTPIAGRRRIELEGLIGFFVNTLVLRSDLSGNPGFRELLARVRERTLGAYSHQELPFENLVEALAPARDMSRNPLFQAMFALQNAPGSALALEGMQVSRVALDGRSAKFDLSLSVHDTPAGLHTRWEFNTDLFDAQTIERMARHFERLLVGIAADQERCIGGLPLLTEAERHQLLVEWNDTALDYPKDRCIHELFEGQAARTPAAVAVVFEDQQLTYAELNARANQLADYLIALGVGPEVLVGVCLERSLELIVGLLAILKAGGVYVPLDPSYPQARLAFMLKDTQAPVLLTQQRLLAQMPPYEGRIVCLDRDWPQISSNQDSGSHAIPVGSAERCVVSVASSSPAYVTYTSGSTGVPKGVIGLHQGTINRISWMWKYAPSGPGDVFCQKTSLSFVDSVCEIFGPLLQGLPLVVVSDECAKDPRRLVELLSTRQVTRIVVVPSLLSALLKTYDDLGDRLPKLRLWATSGEAISPDLVRRFRKQLPKSRLINLYGSSEVSADVTCYDTAATASHLTVPIGRPIANTQVYVLDRHGEPVPVGVAGELYVAGAGLARGYLNHPELTAERFVPDPFSRMPGERMYRMGDLARYLPDGNVEFLGRIDHQVKIRGFRIELGEIEAVLAEHAAVRQAVVLAREDTAGDKRLVAYVVPVDSSLADVEPLRAFLQKLLPDYMQPATYVLLERLPLTPSGKVDRRALPAPQYGREEAGSTFVAPRNEIEEWIAEVWCEVLKIEQVGVHDNFFELGGHSLLATQVLARLARLLNVELPLRRMFEAPTIAELAGDVARMSEGADETALERILHEVEALTDEETALQRDGNWSGG